MDLLYYLFHKKGWDPATAYEKPQGERDLIRAFCEYESHPSP